MLIIIYFIVKMRRATKRKSTRHKGVLHDPYKEMMQITKNRDVSNAFQKQILEHRNLATKRTYEAQLHNMLFQNLAPGLRHVVLNRLKPRHLGMFV